MQTAVLAKADLSVRMFVCLSRSDVLFRLDPKFQVEGVAPANHSSSQKN